MVRPCLASTTIQSFIDTAAFPPAARGPRKSGVTKTSRRTSFFAACALPGNDKLLVDELPGIKGKDIPGAAPFIPHGYDKALPLHQDGGGLQHLPVFLPGFAQGLDTGGALLSHQAVLGFHLRVRKAIRVGLPGPGIQIPLSIPLIKTLFGGCPQGIGLIHPSDEILGIDIHAAEAKVHVVSFPDGFCPSYAIQVGLHLKADLLMDGLIIRRRFPFLDGPLRHDEIDLIPGLYLQQLLEALAFSPVNEYRGTGAAPAALHHEGIPHESIASHTGCR